MMGTQRWLAQKKTTCVPFPPPDMDAEDKG
jgi:hypothetical protein